MIVKTFETQKLLCVRENVYTYGADAKITCSDELFSIARKLGINEAAEEYLYVVCFNAHGKIIAVHEVSHGDLCSSASHPREVFKRALLNNAASIALIHNHPSGNVNASKEDAVTTERIVKSGEILGIPVIDHIIVNGEKYSSMKTTGEM